MEIGSSDASSVDETSEENYHMFYPPVLLELVDDVFLAIQKSDLDHVDRLYDSPRFRKGHPLHWAKQILKRFKIAPKHSDYSV
jgi:hypothetical protein